MWKRSLGTFVGILALIVVGAFVVLGPILLLLIVRFLPLFMPILLGLFVGMITWAAIKKVARSARR